MPSEFDLIRQHFTRPTRHTDLGVGDDGALLRVAPGMQLVVSTDMLVAGTHFLPDAAPADIGWKTAAVNISDMAAMGAQPRWITLALSLPEAKEPWVAAFAAGFAQCCEAFGVDWIGGDTTRGPLNLCATVFGEVPSGQAVLRRGGRAGDDIWVSGTPGLAALGLQQLLGQRSLSADMRTRCLTALHRPQPRVALGLALRGLATAMLDVSDGLAGDLGHILNQSGCGAALEEDMLPMADALAACGDADAARSALLHGGDDYELLFCAPVVCRAQIAALAQSVTVPLSRIGCLVVEAGLQLRDTQGALRPLAARGFDHFGG